MIIRLSNMFALSWFLPSPYRSRYLFELRLVYLQVLLSVKTLWREMIGLPDIRCCNRIIHGLSMSRAKSRRDATVRNRWSSESLSTVSLPIDDYSYPTLRSVVGFAASLTSGGVSNSRAHSGRLFKTDIK